MTASNFERAFNLALRHEGGYVNHPDDNGGPTNRGVTQRTYNAYRRARGLPTRDVRQITMDEVRIIYRERYWNAVQADKLLSGVDYAVYDFAVNSGPSRAVQFLQRIVGVDDDGIMGPKTLAATNRLESVTVIDKLCSNRLQWLRTLNDWKVFGKGWTNRVNEVFKYAKEMVAALGPSPVPEPTHPAPKTSDVTKVVVEKKETGVGRTQGGVVVAGGAAVIYAFSWGWVPFAVTLVVALVVITAVVKFTSK